MNKLKCLFNEKFNKLGKFFFLKKKNKTLTQWFWVQQWMSQQGWLKQPIKIVTDTPNFEMTNARPTVVAVAVVVPEVPKDFQNVEVGIDFTRGEDSPGHIITWTGYVAGHRTHAPKRSSRGEIAVTNVPGPNPLGPGVLVIVGRDLPLSPPSIRRVPLTLRVVTAIHCKGQRPHQPYAKRCRASRYLDALRNLRRSSRRRVPKEFFVAQWHIPTSRASRVCQLNEFQKSPPNKLSCLAHVKIPLDYIDRIIFNIVNLHSYFLNSNVSILIASEVIRLSTKCLEKHFYKIFFWNYFLLPFFTFLKSFFQILFSNTFLNTFFKFVFKNIHSSSEWRSPITYVYGHFVLRDLIFLLHHLLMWNLYFPWGN